MADEILQGYSIPDFFRAHEDLDWKEDTIHRYNRYLYELLDFLDGQEPDPENLEAWKRQIEARCGRSGVNGYLAAANNYLLWCGRPELYLRRTPGESREEEPQPPAVTRTEYLKLLRTARARGGGGPICSSSCSPSPACPSSAWGRSRWSWFGRGRAS